MAQYWWQPGRNGIKASTIVIYKREKRVRVALGCAQGSNGTDEVEKEVKKEAWHGKERAQTASEDSIDRGETTRIGK